MYIITVLCAYCRLRVVRLVRLANVAENAPGCALCVSYMRGFYLFKWIARRFCFLFGCMLRQGRKRVCRLCLSFRFWFCSKRILGTKNICSSSNSCRLPWCSCTAWQAVATAARKYIGCSIKRIRCYRNCRASRRQPCCCCCPAYPCCNGRHGKRVAPAKRISSTVWSGCVVRLWRRTKRVGGRRPFGRRCRWCLSSRSCRRRGCSWCYWRFPERVGGKCCRGRLNSRRLCHHVRRKCRRGCGRGQAAG